LYLAQFWIVSGDSAVGLSQKLFEKYDFNPIDSKSISFKIDKSSRHYKYLDSLKVEIKTQKLDFNFSDLEVIKKKESQNIFIHKFMIDAFFNIDLLFENIDLAENAELYFISDDLREFAGPITTFDLGKKVKPFFHSGLYNRFKKH
jgi:hypothetical protein